MMLLSGFSKLVLNSEWVWIFASANPAVAVSRAFVLEAVTPPRMLTNAISFCGST